MKILFSCKDNQMATCGKCGKPVSFESPGDRRPPQTAEEKAKAKEANDKRNDRRRKLYREKVEEQAAAQMHNDWVGFYPPEQPPAQAQEQVGWEEDDDGLDLFLMQSGILDGDEQVKERNRGFVYAGKGGGAPMATKVKWTMDDDFKGLIKTLNKKG
jgi:hypothetical protein